jgi:Flp pilus assembly pilin Flp
MLAKLKPFIKRTATAIEYGVIAAGLSLAIVTAVNGLFSSISTH